MNKKSKSKFTSLIPIIIIGAFIVILAILLPLQTLCILFLSMIVVGTVIFSILIKLEFKASRIVLDLILELFIVLFIISRNFNYVNGGVFFYIAAGIISAIFIAMNMIFDFNKNPKIGTRLILSLILAFFVFMGTLGILRTVNYAFDFEEPQHIEVTVIDKKYIRYRKAPDQCKLKIKIDGNEYWIQVFDNTYESYDKGDKLIIEKYDGLFNEEFFIA